MSEIEVSPEDLLRSAATLDTVAQDLRNAHGRLDGMRTSQVGASNITRALHSFADEWEFGMGRMVESVHFTAAALRTAGEGYAETESRIIRALRRLVP